MRAILLSSAIALATIAVPVSAEPTRDEERAAREEERRLRDARREEERAAREAAREDRRSRR